jgi:CubicO group peptidase (beta-lactamase class C family)
MRLSSLLACGAVLFTSLSVSLDLRADPIDDAVAEQLAKRKIPGLSLAVIDGGEIVKAKGYGFADVANRTPVTPATLFQAGSISKPVAAVGVLALVADGKLKLDEDINVFLKSWHLAENEFTREQKATVRRLLSHTAGVTVHGFPGYPVVGPVATQRQVLDGDGPANTKPLHVDVLPGSIFRYSGGGYTILQQAMIDVTGNQFPELMRERVLKPFGMHASTYEQPLPAARQPETAHAYRTGGSPVPGRWHVYPEMAAAGLWTTASDLARFAIGLQRSLAGKGATVLTAAQVREAFTVQKDNYALGFAMSGEGATRRFGHNGRDEGFDALLTAYCETGQGVVLMINTNDNSAAMRRIVDVVAEAYRWAGHTRYRPPAAIADTEPGVTAGLRTIVERARTGKFDRAQFTAPLAEQMAVQLAPGGAARVALQEFGALRSVELLNRRVVGTLTQYRYRFIFENDTAIVVYGRNGEGKIAMLGLQPE